MKSLVVLIGTCIVVMTALSSCIGGNHVQHDILAQMPTYRPEKDIPNNAWGNEERVAILGYSADAMEVGISQDGRYLLFNDRNKPNKDMHWAERIDDTTYQYKGKVRNTVTPTVDGTPSFDVVGNIYFTSLKSYPRDVRTIYKAVFKDGAALNPVPVDGNIYITERNRRGIDLWVSLDPDISDDGAFLFFSEGRFRPGVGFPYPFNVRGAQKVDGKYLKIDDRILATTLMKKARSIDNSNAAHCAE